MPLNNSPSAAKTPLSLLEIATARHRAGDRAEARRLYRQILDDDPAQTLAAFRAGLLEFQEGRLAPARTLMEGAIAGAPLDPRHRIGLGQVLQALEHWDEAAAEYRRALELDPDCADTHFALGMVLQALNRFDEAADAYAGAIERRSDFFAALNNLGNCRQRGGRWIEAAAAYGQALAVRPGETGAMANLGSVLQAIGRVDEAVALLRAATAAEPLVDAHAINLAIALCRGRDFVAAESVLRPIFGRNPLSADAAFNLGNALQGLGRPHAAAELYHQAIAIRPDFPDALINLGNVHRGLGAFEAAAASYATAIHAAPDSVVAINNLGCLLRTLGRFDAAEAMLRQGLLVDPHHAALYDNLGSVLKDTGDLDAAIEAFRKSLQLNPDNAATHSNLAYTLSFQSHHAQPILDECRRWNERFAAGLNPGTARHANDRSADRRLRIGYVSPDFRDHCQSLFTLPLLSQHDHAAFEVFVYASVDRPDDITERLRPFADVWRDVRLLDDAALAGQIRSDEIDILIDLTMHMASGRPRMFARKPAPIQIAWLAYPGTTGLRAMDYRLSDARLDPVGADGDYVERTIRLPDSFWCYDPLATTPRVNALPALERGHVTLGCLNNPCKVTSSTLRLWGTAMRVLDTSRLMLMVPSGSRRERMLERLTACGISAERVDFVPFQIRADYLRAYHDIDLGLDTFPYNGHTTSLDACWMGVPTVSRVGATSVGRAGLSQSFQLGMPQLAAHTDTEFVDAVVSLAQDLPRLAELRQTLRATLENSPLMDAKRFAGNVEAAYRTVWHEFTA